LMMFWDFLYGGILGAFYWLFPAVFFIFLISGLESLDPLVPIDLTLDSTVVSGISIGYILLLMFFSVNSMGSKPVHASASYYLVCVVVCLLQVLIIVSLFIGTYTEVSYIPSAIHHYIDMTYLNLIGLLFVGTIALWSFGTLLAGRFFSFWTNVLQYLLMFPMQKIGLLTHSIATASDLAKGIRDQHKLGRKEWKELLEIEEPNFVLLNPLSKEDAISSYQFKFEAEERIERQRLQAKRTVVMACWILSNNVAMVAAYFLLSNYIAASDVATTLAGLIFLKYVLGFLSLLIASLASLCERKATKAELFTLGLEENLEIEEV